MLLRPCSLPVCGIIQDRTKSQKLPLTFIRIRSIITLSEFGESEKTMKPIHTKEMAEVNRLYKETDSIYTKYAATHGISTTTLCVLYSLYTAETPCTQTRLLEDWGIPMQTINSCLKALEKSGTVRLEFMEGSRKSKHIFLTEQGEKTADRIIAPLIRAENAAFGALTQEERQLLLKITQKHNRLLREFLFE